MGIKIADNWEITIAIVDKAQGLGKVVTSSTLGLTHAEEATLRSPNAMDIVGEGAGKSPSHVEGTFRSLDECDGEDVVKCYISNSCRWWNERTMESNTEWWGGEDVTSWDRVFLRWIPASTISCASVIIHSFNLHGYLFSQEKIALVI